MKVYSPSRVTAYDRCSMYGELAYNQGWEPKEAGNSLIGRLLGAAFAVGTAIIHMDSMLVEQDPNVAEAAVKAAQEHWRQSVLHYTTHGVEFWQDLGKPLAQLGESLVAYARVNPFKSWSLKGVEFPMGEAYGNCRFDVVGVDPDGYWCIADLKYKRTLNMQYLSKTVEDYRDSWQFQHYPWAWNDMVSKRPDCDRIMGLYAPVAKMVLVLVVAEPFKVLTFPFFVKEKLLKLWLPSAQQKWQDLALIQSGERQPTLAASHRDGFGECPMRRACLEFQCDPDLMRFEYAKVPRMEGG